MKCVFVTRCSRPDNIKRISENIESVFRGSRHTYRHVLVCDITESYEDLKEYARYDLNAFIQPVIMKHERDKYLTNGIDTALFNLNEDGCYVYILDDDNLIMPEFLDALDEAERTNAVAVVFKVKDHPQWGKSNIEHNNAVGRIDWSNFITRIDVMRAIGVYNQFCDSHDSDGEFFNDLLEFCDDGEIVYMDKVCGLYNALR